MSYAYQVCPDCYGMIKADTKSNVDKIEADNKIENEMRSRIKEEVVKTSSPEKTFGLKNLEKKGGAKGNYGMKRAEAVKYFNKLKSMRKAGKLNPPNLTDDQLWGYAIHENGLIDQ